MYANSYGQASPPPQLTNNPFVADPATAHARFPDLTASTYSAQFPQSSGPYQTQQQPIQPQTQFTTSSYTPQYPAQAPLGPPFQPINVAPQQYPIPSYSYANYAQAPPPTTAAPSYLAEFDPYGQVSQNQNQVVPNNTSASHAAPPGVVHPRDAIRIHKAGLEAWDTYSWKQLLSACDALKEAWHRRKMQAESVVRQYGGHAETGFFGPDPAFGYQSQVEGWKQVLKDANDNFDTVAASTFQLHEVFNSYRQSGDQASKRRVRESCNAAVKGLPDWPSN